MASKRNIIGGSDGWLNIKIEPSGQIVAVPEHLQIDLTENRHGRDYFTILEGVHKGRRCSVTARNLSPGAVPLRPAARLVFFRSRGELVYGTAKLRAQMDPPTPSPTASIRSRFLISRTTPAATT